MNEIRTAFPSKINFRMKRESSPKTVKLHGREQVAAGLETNRPNRVGPQGLGRFGPINRYGAQAEQAEARFENQLAAFVGIQQRAVLEIEMTGCAAGHDISNSIKDGEACRGHAEIGKP